MDINFIDDPQPKGKAKLAIFITESIQEYEPRVQVVDVDFVPDTDSAMNGKMFPKVTVIIKDEYIE